MGKEYSKPEAIEQLESIREMVDRLDQDSDKEREDALQEILDYPLSVEVRSGWCSPSEELRAAEYSILLCTGGPAVRIRGELQDEEPISAWIEHQDWGTPWTVLYTSTDENEALLKYAGCFYFGEGVRKC